MMGAFLAALLATLALLGGVIATGLRRRRRAHYALVAAFFASLGITIWRAEVMGAAGGGLRFEAAATAQLLHRIAVSLTFALVPPLLGTGVRLARAAPERETARRRTHRGMAFAFVAGVALSAILGAVMTWQALAATG
jgi:hypothetical protein